MLAKYNLYVGNECTDSVSSSCIAYGDEATGKQNSTMLGYGDNQTTVRKGVIGFAKNTYWYSTVSSYPAYVYDSNSTLYNYVENYKTYLNSLGVTIKEARLITYEELTFFGCDVAKASCYSAPKWVYNTSYWTGSVSSTSHVLGIFHTGYFIQYLISSSTYMGVRPVITIPKWVFADTIEFTIDGTTYKAKEGMTWKEWVNSKYNTIGLIEYGMNIINNSHSKHLTYNNIIVISSDIIDSSKTYILTSGSGGGGI